MSKHIHIQRQSEDGQLSVEECRALMGWKDHTDEEIRQFLESLRNYLEKFLDDHFRDEIPDEDL